MLHSGVRKFENLHIVFWLIKDSCWMLELKAAGTFMIIPAIYLAIDILIRTKKHPEFWLNASILCWICANSYWMIMEFFFEDRYRLLAGIPFLLGLFFVALFYFRSADSQKDSQIT